MIAFIIIAGVVERAKGHLPCGVGFQPFHFLDREYLIIQRMGSVHHQMLFRRAVRDIDPGGDAGKQVDNRGTKQAELCRIRLVDQPVRRQAIQQDNNLRHAAVNFL